jgi:hypothetical protein
MVENRDIYSGSDRFYVSTLITGFVDWTFRLVLRAWAWQFLYKHTMPKKHSELCGENGRLC